MYSRQGTACNSTVFVLVCVCVLVRCVCCSSLLLQQLQTVLSVVRRSVAGVDGRTVLREEHQVLQAKQEHKHMDERL